MDIKKIGAPVALLTAAALSLTACAANETPASNAGTTAGASGALSGTLNGKGASSASAAQGAWRAAFQTANSGVTVNYSPDGSGAGITAFTSGAVQFAGSDRALNDTEMGAGKFGKCASTSNALDLPIYISPIAVFFKVDGVKDLKLDADTTASIFAGKITKWNDAKIAALNPSANLPAANITAVHRSDDSGTTTNFTDYLHQAAPTVWTDKAAGLWPATLKGEAAAKTSGVVDAVKGGTNTIGYADESAVTKLVSDGTVAVASLRVGTEDLKPTADGAAKIVDASKQVSGRATNDLAYQLDRTAAGVYPAVLVSYAIVCEQYKDANDAKLVKAYLGYITSATGQTDAQKVAGNAPLSATLSAKVKVSVDSIK